MAEDRFKIPNRVNIFQDMLRQYKEGHAQGNTEITDFGEGTELGTLLHSIAVELEAIYVHEKLLHDQRFVKTAVGTYLDMLACEHHIQRFNGSFAHGIVQFTVYGENAVARQDIVIPAGTKILHRRNGLQYILVNDCVIPQGASQSSNVSVVAEHPGSKYNCKSYMLTSFSSVSTWANQIYVANPTPIVGGKDPETDDQLRQRILEVKRSNVFGTLGWYKTQCEMIPGVHDVAFINPNEEGIDHKITRNGVTRKCTDCTRIVYVNKSEDWLTENDEYLANRAILNVTNFLENQNNTVLGHKFHIEEAKPVRFFLEIYAYDKGIPPAEDELMQCLSAYFDGGTVTQGKKMYTYRGLDIGSSVKKGEIIDALEHLDSIEQVEGVYLLKYNDQIEAQVKDDITAYWNEVPGTSLYTYTDDDGYVFEAKNVHIGQPHYDFWGRKSFVSYKVPIDSYPTIRGVDEIYEEKKKNNPNSYTDGMEWYRKWSDEWYNPNYTQIIYHSLGTATDETYLTSDSSTQVIIDGEEKLYRGPNNEMPMW